MASNPSGKIETRNRRDLLAYVANLRHAKASLQTALNNLDACIVDAETNRVSAEGLKEVRQDTLKGITAIDNELSRHPITSYLKEK